MSGSESYGRLVWTDRFIKPSVESLRAGLNPQQRRHFDSVRKHLVSLEQIREEVTWYGECWKWAIEYRTRSSKPPHDPLALLIPCPDDLQLALPLDREFISKLPMKRMKRAVRDGIELAQEPFDTRWSVWSLGGPSKVLDDLQDLIELKLQHHGKRAG